MTTARSAEQAVEEVVELWYREIDYYNYAKPSYRGPNGEALGHFTQLVWKASTKLGIGVSMTKFESGGRLWDAYIVVAHYSPTGNFNSAFGDNVMPLK